jgi:glycosyltransferase involved in cell wall biosynthesis
MSESPFEPKNAEQFSRDLAAKINQLMRDEPLRTKFGKAGRQRAEEHFSWAAIAEQVKDLYASLA